MARDRKHISLIVRGPIKSARRAAARHGLSPSSCVDMSAAGGRRGERGDIQCYVPCPKKGSAANSRVIDWYAANTMSPAKGRGHAPGTLLYHGPLCETAWGRSTRKPRRKRRST